MVWLPFFNSVCSGRRRTPQSGWTRRPNPHHVRRLALEALEDRLCLTTTLNYADPTFISGGLIHPGPDGQPYRVGDQIRVSVSVTPGQWSASEEGPWEPGGPLSVPGDVQMTATTGTGMTTTTLAEQSTQTFAYVVAAPVYLSFGANGGMRGYDPHYNQYLQGVAEYQGELPHWNVTLTVISRAVTFVEPPTSTDAGQAMHSAVQVAVQRPDGTRDTSYSGPVTLQLQDGTGATAALSGPHVAAAVNGVATFTGLSVAAPGQGYTLTAALADGTRATSAPFNIGAPDLEIDINDTRDPGDNITLLNPDGPLAYLQTIPAKVINHAAYAVTFQVREDLARNGPGAGYGEVLFEQLGKASVPTSQLTLTLAAGASTEITLVPTGDSITANDVRVEALEGGVPIGSSYDYLTVVRVSFPTHIRDDDTPYNMPDRIAPTVALPVPVEVTPALDSAGGLPLTNRQLVTFAVAGQSVEHGTVSFGGLLTADVAHADELPLAGITQTAPAAALETNDHNQLVALPSSNANAGQLHLVLRVRGQDTVESNGFSVAAIPIAVRATMVGTTDAAFPGQQGLDVQYTVASDSGNPDDLNGVAVQFNYNYVLAEGFLSDLPVYSRTVLLPDLAATPIFYHLNDAALLSAADPEGMLALDELLTFFDPRTAAGDVTIAHSGFDVLIVTTKLRDQPDHVGESFIVRATDVAFPGDAAWSGFTANAVAAQFFLTKPSTLPVATPPAPLSNETIESLHLTTVNGPTAPTRQLKVLSQPPSQVVAGTPFGLTVGVVNTAGAVDTSADGSVVVRVTNSGDGLTGTLATPLIVPVVKGIAQVAGLTLDNAGTFQLTVQSNDAAAVATRAVTISSPAVQLRLLSALPATMTAGAGFRVKMGAVDATGNVDPTFHGPVTLSLASNPASDVLGGHLTATAVNGVATFTGLTLDRPAIGDALVATASKLIPLTTAAITVLAPGVATRLVVATEPPASVTAGTSFGLIVQAEDDFGTVATTWNGLVTVANPAGGAPLGQAQAVNGVATFTGLTLTQAATFTLSATTPGLVAPATTGAIAIVAAPASQLVVLGRSATVLPGVPFRMTVAALDPNGNVDGTFNGSVTLTRAGGNGALGGTLTVNAVQGSATFADLTLSTAGAGFTLQAASSGLTAATSDSFAVAADQLVVTGLPPGPLAPGASFGVTVAVHDAAGNLVTASTGTVTLALADPNGTGGVLGGTLVAPLVNGRATFAGMTMDRPGAYALSVTSGAGDAILSKSITVLPAASLAIAGVNVAIRTVNTTYSTASQSVSLTATVQPALPAHGTAAGAVNEGSVTFTVLNGSGAPVGMLSGVPVVNGAASAAYNVSLAAGKYQVLAAYVQASSLPHFSAARARTAGTLTVAPDITTVRVTSTGLTLPFAATPQTVDLTALVQAANAGSTVNEGTVRFTIVDTHQRVLGNAVLSSTVIGGMAHATSTVPARAAAGVYTIHAAYVPTPAGADFIASTDTGPIATLTIR